MNKSLSRILFLLLINSIGFSLHGFGQSVDKKLEDLKKSAPRVFIDCHRCDRDYFREHITYVNYVRDRKEADIHVLITSQHTGSSGNEYTFAFIGLKEFAAISHTLIYNSGPNDTRDDIRRGQLELLQKGLFPFILKTPISRYIKLEFEEKLEPTAVVDPWNFWVFNIGLEGSFSGEASRKSSSVEVDLSANRVTPELKVRMSVSGEFDRRKYQYDDDTIISKSDEKDATVMIVKSLGQHWSIGGWLELESSTYHNQDLQFMLAPALEFNVFPYAESTRRQFSFLYRVGWSRVKYLEETIFNRISETLYGQSLTLSFEMKEPWGRISSHLEGSHYFHDWKKNRLEFGASLDLRVTRGLFLELGGSYERIHDQLSLPKGDASIDEVILSIKELETNYEYKFSVGLSYTFGSVYSNVVNPRFRH